MTASKNKTYQTYLLKNNKYVSNNNRMYCTMYDTKTIYEKRKNFHVFIQTTEKYMFMNMLQVNEHFVSFFYNTFCVHGTIFLEMLNMNNCVNSIE